MSNYFKFQFISIPAIRSKYTTVTFPRPILLASSFAGDTPVQTSEPARKQSVLTMDIESIISFTGYLEGKPKLRHMQ